MGLEGRPIRTLKDLVLPDDVPDWAKDVQVARFKGADAPLRVHRIELTDPRRWKPHRIEELFDIRKGKRLTKANMKRGPVPFIGAIDKNNGISNFVQTAIHSGNTITVNYNGSVAEAFYQPRPFWCSDDVNVLYAKFPLTSAIAVFITAVIRLERYRFNYGRKWHLERMRTAVIRLPVDAQGVPDWDYMQSYIESLPFSSAIVLNDPACLRRQSASEVHSDYAAADVMGHNSGRSRELREHAEADPVDLPV